MTVFERSTFNDHLYGYIEAGKWIALPAGLM
jgi:hypothetical protein